MRIVNAIFAKAAYLLFWIPIALLATPFFLLSLAFLPQRRELAFAPVRSRSLQR